MPHLISTITHALSDVCPAGEARAIARMVLSEAFGVSELDIYMGKDIHLSEDEQQKLENIIFRLHKNEPIQYILGYAYCLGVRFRVTPSVLIPRPETAELIELIKLRYAGIAPRRILDIGTGSGCIAISLANHWRESEVEAWDVSAEALEVACDNSRQAGVQVSFKQCDVLTRTPQTGDEGRFDLIVSNPPYIKEVEKETMEAHVLDWEPSLALFVPNHDPLLFYRKISVLSLSMLADGGMLYFEINREHGAELVGLLVGLGYKDVELSKDLSGNDRFVSACKRVTN